MPVAGRPKYAPKHVRDKADALLEAAVIVRCLMLDGIKVQAAYGLLDIVPGAGKANWNRLLGSVAARMLAKRRQGGGEA